VNSINDSTQHVALETSCQHTLHMWRVQEHSVLVVAVDNKVDKAEYMQHVLDALEIIEQGKGLQVAALYTYAWCISLAAVDVNLNKLCGVDAGGLCAPAGNFHV
jgi:hypothetical protein